MALECFWRTVAPQERRWAGRANLFESFEKSQIRASVPFLPSPSARLSFRVARRVAAGSRGSPCGTVRFPYIGNCV